MFMKLSLGVAFVVVTSLLAAANFKALADRPQEQPKPGPEHAILKDMVGDWVGDVTEMDPSGKVLTSKSEQTNTLTAGGLFLVSDFKGKMQGQDFSGHGINGWNPMKKKYEMVWVDSMTPNLVVNEGEWDAKTMSLWFWQEVPSPDGKMIKCKSLTTMPDKDHMSFRFQMPAGDDKWTDLIKIDYVRKSAAKPDAK